MSFNDGTAGTTSLDVWGPRVLADGPRYARSGKLTLVAEGRVYIAGFADLRAVGHSMGGAVRELHARILCGIENAALDAAARRSLTQESPWTNE